MKQTFQTAWPYKATGLTILTLLFSLALYKTYTVDWSNQVSLGSLSMILGLFGLNLLSTWFILEFVFIRITIGKHLKFESILSKKYLQKHKVGGFTSHKKLILIRKRFNDRFFIPIPFWLEEFEVVKLLIQKEYTDLSKHATKRNKKPNLRAKESKKINSNVNYLTAIGIILFFTILFTKKYVLVHLIINTLIPILALLLTIRHKKRIKDYIKETESSYGFFSFGVPLFNLYLLNNNYNSYWNFTAFAISIGIAGIGWLILLSKNYTFLKSNVSLENGLIKATLLIYLTSFIYLNSKIINCRFDNTKPVIVHAKIIERDWYLDDNQKYYYFVLDIWGPDKEEIEVTIQQSTYQRYKEGDQYPIVLRKGFFDMPWYTYRR